MARQPNYASSTDCDNVTCTLRTRLCGVSFNLLSCIVLRRQKRRAVFETQLLSRAKTARDALEVEAELILGGRAPERPPPQQTLPQQTIVRQRIAAEATAPLALYRLFASAQGGEASVRRAAVSHASAGAGAAAAAAATPRVEVVAGAALEAPRDPAADPGAAAQSLPSLRDAVVLAKIEAHARMWEATQAATEASYEPSKQQRRIKVHRPRG